MNVWLDDVREAPKGWIRAYTSKHAIALLETGTVKAISLDHDLGDDVAGTGYSVLLWIEELASAGMQPPLIMIHTANPAARTRMYQAVEAIWKLYNAYETGKSTS